MTARKSEISISVTEISLYLMKSAGVVHND